MTAADLKMISNSDSERQLPGPTADARGDEHGLGRLRMVLFSSEGSLVFPGPIAADRSGRSVGSSAMTVNS